MKRLHRSEAGAAMVFGICFAVFLLAMVYYLVGTAETVLFRERLQDAADTGAFSAAVVNARGMNLIALINLVMAVILSVFVGLRLAQTLCYAGIIVCGVLAWPTYGASLSAVGPLANAAKQIHDAAEKYKKTMKQALSVLHTAGKATSVAVPWGSNLRVLDQSATYGALGVVIPARVSLPVEDDEFSVLCEHAGLFVGEVALLPVSFVLPKSIEEKLEGAVANIVAAGSGWFCDGEGDPPDLNGDEDTALVELPRFPSQEQCDVAVEAIKRGERDDASEEEVTCTRASVERLASMPSRLGLVRAGEPVCPQDCQGSSRNECPPKGVPDCEPEEALRIDSMAPSVLGASFVTAGKSSPYERRLALSRAQCKPESEHGRGDLVGFWWLERTRERVYHWHPTLRAWVEDESVVITSAPRLVQTDDDDDTFPCGEDGAIAETYESDSTKSVCEGKRACKSTSVGLHGDEPCRRLSPLKGESTTFRELSTEVVAIVRCAYEVEVAKVETPALNLGDDVNGGESQGGESGQNVSPFRLEKDVYLGGSDFQLRTVVYDGDVPEGAQGVVEMAKWGAPTDDGALETTGSGLAKGFQAMGRVALGQAEYYFDWTGIDDELDDETDEGDRTEWMWNLGWRARMRPFRFRHSVADAERREKGCALDSEQSALMPDEAKSQETDQLDCETLGDGCEHAQRVIDVFGGGDDEEE